MTTTFNTNPVRLSILLDQCRKGEIQLPDFQRSWVWDDDRIRSLIASISQSFPVGALMTLRSGGEVNFSPRPIQGAPASAVSATIAGLILDGQQRMTSLYQALLRKEVIRTKNSKGIPIDRFYYVDMLKALDSQVAREDAIIGVPADKMLKSDFGKKIELDLSSAAAEYAALHFPLNATFDWDGWQDGFTDHWMDAGDADKRTLFRRFKNEVLTNFSNYDVPVIELGTGTSREAICLVFEKVNTGGKPLDAFELVTAIYAASGFKLREDWAAREKRLHANPTLKNVGAIDFMQTISLLHTARVRRERAATGSAELSPISATRASLLRLPLSAYQEHADTAEAGYLLASRFLHRQSIFRVLDLPYQSQLTPLAAILAENPTILEQTARFDRLSRWYWCGVFGELYGGATETRMAKDYAEVPAWAQGDVVEPTTVVDATFRADRLLTLTSRLSAAYKGVNARLMEVGARDFRSGQKFGATIFFDEFVDIHHIFPKAWCEKRNILPRVFNGIANKTPLTWKTNRIIGGGAPSAYLARLQRDSDDDAALAASKLDGHLLTHCIDPALLRCDDFEAFMTARREALLGLIEAAMGKSVYREGSEESAGEGDDDGEADNQRDAPFSIAAE